WSGAIPQRPRDSPRDSQTDIGSPADRRAETGSKRSRLPAALRDSGSYSPGLCGRRPVSRRNRRSWVRPNHGGVGDEAGGWQRVQAPASADRYQNHTTGFGERSTDADYEWVWKKGFRLKAEASEGVL